jgi:hypothetical protein
VSRGPRLRPRVGGVYSRFGMSSGLGRASIGVTPSTSGGKPEPAQVQRAAEELSRLGFEVLRTGRRGVSVQAEPDRFAEAFGVRPEPGQALVLKLHPDRPELAALVESLEVVPEPLELVR